MPEPHTHTPSLRASMRDGVAHAVMLGSGETYLSALAIFLGAGALQLGLLAAIPPLLGACFQLLGVLAVDRAFSRRRVITSAAIGQGLVLLPIALLPFFPIHWDRGASLILLAAVYYALAGLGVPVWNSLIGDLVPVERRGRFFGTRSRRCGLATGLALVIAGGFLELFRTRADPALGFTLVFLAACMARLVSSYWLSRHEDPKHKLEDQHKFTFLDFVLKVRHSNFARFVLFVGMINFGLFFAAPFFALYMLETLKLPYAEFTLLIFLATFAQYLTLGRWGEISDLFGNRRIITLCAVLLCITPLLWLVSSNLWYLCIVQLFSGFAHAGFSLANANFLFDAVTPPKRARCVAYQSIVNGGFIFAGALLGGYASKHVSFDFFTNPWLQEPHSPLLMLFLLSGLLRAVAVLIFLPLFQEVREVTPIRSRALLLRVVHIRPNLGMTFGIIGGKGKGSGRDL
jgi:MFS family permease